MLPGTFNPLLFAQSLTLHRVYLLNNDSPWTVDATWNSSNNTVDTFGAGAGGGNSSAYGGGGGAFSRKLNVSLTPGGSVNYGVGLGGVGVASTTTNPGGDTWFGGTNFATAICAAKGGQGGTTPGLGGAAASGIGDVKYSGGDGYYGGGGAAGPNGNGGNANSGSASIQGGVGGAGAGGAGGDLATPTPGGAGTEYDATHGSGGGGGSRGFNNVASTGGNGGLYGGGGGDGGTSGSTGGNGAQGMIVLTWYT